ncbi:MAG: hypothetical protein KA401_00380 [Anaerolineae bacterium]|nr:hypothetical protein [Chloroflexota bacterium]MBP6297772.1 hypothetical protein [Anaerolineae bacterium]
MIIQSESGLTAPVYNALNTFDGEKHLKVVARRWWPKYGAHFGVNAALSTPLYDALYYNNRIYHWHGNTLRYCAAAGGSWTTESATFIPTSRTGVNRPAMCTDGTAQHALRCTELGIYTNRRATGGSAWSGWVGPIAAPAAHANTQTASAYSADRCTGGSVVTSGAPVNPGTNAFDNSSSTYYKIAWVAGTSPTLQYTHASTRVIRRVTVRVRDWVSGDSDFTTASKNTPRRFTIQYHNGAGYVDLVTIKSQKGWKPGEQRVYDFANGATATQWRIRWERINGGTHLEVAEVEMMDITTSTGQSYEWAASPVANPTRVYAFYRRYDTNVWQLHRAVRTDATLSTWTWATSDIYWTYKPQSFEVVTDPNDSERDLIFFTSQVPGDLTQRFESGELKTYFYNATALICIAYKNGVYGDPVIIDRAPDASRRIIKNATATVINGKIYVMAYSDDANKVYSSETEALLGNVDPTYMTSLYTSIDGRTWSKPQHIQSGEYGGVTPTNDMIAEILPAWNSGYVLLSPNHAWFSVPTRMFGTSVDASVETDLTDRLLDYSRNHSEMVDASFTIANDDDFYATDPVLSTNSLVAFDHYVSADTVNWFLMATTYLDTADNSHVQSDDTIEDVITVSSRDKFSWMTDHFAVAEPLMADGQMVGLDSFSEDPEDDAGGFAHTAVQTGDWSTQDGQLYQTSSGEAIAFSTFDANLWNGIVKAGVGGTRGAAETGGVVFRAIDKRNYYAWYQEASGGSTTAYLIQVRDGTPTTLFSVNIGSEGILGVEFRCGLVTGRYSLLSLGQFRVVTATAQVLPYTIRQNTLYDNPTQLTALTEEVPERGFVGVLSRIA